MLERAADRLGGMDDLARYLDASPILLRVWLRGLASPPDEVFLKLVDLLQEPPPGPRLSARGPGGKVS